MFNTTKQSVQSDYPAKCCVTQGQAMSHVSPLPQIPATAVIQYKEGSCPHDMGKGGTQGYCNIQNTACKIFVQL